MSETRTPAPVFDAILVDATIIRLILVPAVMDLLGEVNWWFPRWLGL